MEGFTFEREISGKCQCKKALHIYSLTLTIANTTAQDAKLSFVYSWSVACSYCGFAQKFRLPAKECTLFAGYEGSLAGLNELLYNLYLEAIPNAKRKTSEGQNLQEKNGKKTGTCFIRKDK